jgi:hypothetical protein
MKTKPFIHIGNSISCRVEFSRVQRLRCEQFVEMPGHRSVQGAVDMSVAASTRETTRSEDVAYFLIGIDVKIASTTYGL